MKRNLFEVLGVDKNAPPALIDHAFKVALSLQETHQQQGDVNAHGEIVIIKEAYSILSSPEKRVAYVASLDNNSAVANSVSSDQQFHDSAQESIFLTWWYTSKTSMLLVGILLLLSAFIGTNYFKAASSKAINDKSLEAQVKTSSDIMDIAKQEEERRQAELLLREKNEQIRLEMQQRELEARLDAQRRNQDYQQEIQQRQIAEQDKRRTEQENRRVADLAQQKERDANMRAERERRYYACLNPAITNYGLERAQIMCANYR